LVLAHSSCNNSKRHYLASHQHLRNWLDRFQSGQIKEILEPAAIDLSWECRPNNSLGIARSTYLQLPAGTQLCDSGKTFISLQHQELESVFAAKPQELSD